MTDMKIPLLGMSRQVVEIGLHNVFDIVESIWHGTLKYSAHIFQSKWDFSIGKGPPSENEIRLLLIWRENFDMIIAGEAIHEWKYDTPGTFIDNLIDVGGGEIVFWISPI